MEQLREDQKFYVTDKRVQLNAPGTIVDNNYYDDSQVRVDRVETTWYTGRYSASLSNLSFGSQSQVTIPRSSILKDCWLHIEIPDLVADQTVPRGWGYACIDKLDYLMGSSNVSQITVNGQTNFQRIMIEAPTAEKRSELLRLGGEEYLVPKGDTLHAYIRLALPWSTAGMNKKGVDTLMLDSPITLSIRLNQAVSIYGGAGAKPSACLKAEVITLQGELTNKDDSLSRMLMRDAKLRYNYPFIHSQSSVISVSATAGVPLTLSLLGFINADLLGISFGMVDQDKVYDPSGAQPPNPFDYDEVEDINLTYNGLQVFTLPKSMHKLAMMRERLGAAYVENSSIAAGTTAPFTSSPVNTYPVHMDFSQWPVHQFGERFQNVWRIGNQTLDLKVTPTSSGAKYVYLTYLYNGVVAMNRQSDFIFD